MEINDIIRLMQAVSENGLTSFKIEEGNLKLSIKKEKEQIITVAGNSAVQQMIPAAGVAAKARRPRKTRPQPLTPIRSWRHR